MSIMRVYVDGDGRFAVTPEPDPLGADGPVFAGASPAEDFGSLQGYQVELDDDLVLGRGERGEEQLRQSVAGLLKRRTNLPTVEVFQLEGEQR